MSATSRAGSPSFHLSFAPLANQRNPENIMKPNKLDLEINEDEDDAAIEMEDIIAG